MSYALLASFSLLCADAGLALAPVSLAPVALAAATPAPAKAKAGAVARPAEVVSAPKEEALALAFGAESDAAVVEKALAAIEAITTLEGDFTQIAPSGAASKGRFWLRRPGLLRFEYDAPSPLLIVATGGTVFVRDEALETTDSYPVGKTPLKFLLRKRVELGDAKVVAVDRGIDSVAVTFASSGEETDGDLSVIFDGDDLALKQWIVRDPQNGATIVSLANVVAGQPIANRLFAAPETGSSFLKN